MIKINLLPYREKRKEVHTKREGLALFLTIALFLLLFGAVHLYMVQSLDKLRAEVRKSDNELKKLAQITMDIGKFKKNKELLEKKLQIINALDHDRLDPVYFLEELTTMVPPGQMWIKAMTETDVEMKIEGFAKDNITIAKFMKNLEKSRFFKSVDLVSSKQTELVGYKVKQFTLSCGLKKGL
jgi:type IV pilus assembly protein PilN